MVKLDEEVRVLGLALSLEKRVAPVAINIISLSYGSANSLRRLWASSDLLKHLHELEVIVVQIIERPFICK